MKMTQEEKDLLLKDLCARLPYGVFIHYHWSCEGKTIDEDRELDFSDVETLKHDIENPQNYWCEISWKPYLRPMSSMTDEEFKELHNICPHSTFNKTNVPGWIIGINGSEYGRISHIDEISKLIDWLNANQFDYCDLIPMGLALEAEEGMYKID